MFKSSIQTQLYLLCIVIVLFTAGSFSITYYVLTKQGKQRESQQRLQIAFRIIRDDLAEVIHTDSTQLEEFSQQATLLTWLLSQYQQASEKPAFFSSISNAANVSMLSRDLLKFGDLITTNHILLYSADTRLILAYHRESDQGRVGVYAISGTGNDTYLPAEDYLQLTMNNEPIPDIPLPAAISSSYRREMPDSPVVEQISEGAQLGIRNIMPLYQDEERVGILVNERWYTQDMTARYAALSLTEVNFFAGNRFSVGTLPEQTELDPDAFANFVSCDALFKHEAQIAIAPIMLGEQSYYAEQCVINDLTGTPIGAITVNLSQQIERQEVDKLLRSMLVIAGTISLVAMGLSLLVSRKSVRFLQRVIHHIHQLASGDIPDKITEAYKGEFHSIKQHLNLLIDATEDTTRVAEEISEGNLMIDVKERAEHDRLMQALNRMIGRLNAIVQDVDDLVHAVQNGNLEVRGNTERFAGIWGDVMLGINSLIDAFVQPITMTAGHLDRLARGDIPQPITEEYQGDFNEIRNHLNTLIATINGLLQETNGLSLAVQHGELHTRGNADAFENGWRDLVLGINGVIEAFMSPLMVTATYLDRLSQGDIPTKMTEEYQGDFNAIKTSLNVLIEVMQEISGLAEEMAAGDLTIEVKERSEQDALMQALNTMITRLNEVVIQVQVAANNVAAGSREVQVRSEEMSQGASEQAAASEEASSSMEEMTANIRQNAENARQTERIALQSAQYAEESSRVVAETVLAMQQIAKTISIIQEIADQTRMLSLNATIEAARAQEHGKAFSVVASEVRKLSDITKRAAEEINELASSSVGVAENAGEMLAKLVPNIHKTAELVQEISAASHEQSSSAEHINKAIQQLDQVTQHNSLLSENLTSASGELSAQAKQLWSIMRFFRIDERLHTASDARPHPTEPVPSQPVSASGDREKRPPVQAVDDTREEADEGRTAPGQALDLDIGRDDRDDEFERY